VLRPQSGVRSHCRKSFFAEMLARSFSRESGGKLPDIHHYLKRLTAHNAVCKELIAQVGISPLTGLECSVTNAFSATDRRQGIDPKRSTDSVQREAIAKPSAF
jgi:hypothetical protein